MKFINPDDVMMLTDAENAQAERLMQHCADHITKQRNDDPTLKSFPVSTADFSKAEKKSSDTELTGLSVKVRVEVEERAKAEGWKVAYDVKSGLTFTPKRSYKKRTPAVVVETPETPAEGDENKADTNSEAA